MSRSYDAVVIGAGHNGLVTSAYLARAGQSVLVVEQRSRVGGGASSEELFPGFTCDTGTHRAAKLHPSVASDLNLRSYGLEMVRADPALFVPDAEGRHLLLRGSASATADSIRAFSAGDAERWADFESFTGMVAGFLSSVFSIEPPEIPDPSRSGMVALGRLGLGLRKLGRREQTIKGHLAHLKAALRDERGITV